MPPGSVKGLQMVVEDINEVHETLKKNGVEVSYIDHQPWGDFVYFTDPDGNKWALQAIPKKTS